MGLTVPVLEERGTPLVTLGELANGGKGRGLVGVRSFSKIQ